VYPTFAVPSQETCPVPAPYGAAISWVLWVQDGG